MIQIFRLNQQIGGLLQKGKEQVAQSVNTILVQTYWLIGRHVVEYEQGGNEKSEYGSFLFDQLSKDLTRLYGKGFSRANLLYMRKLYLTFPKRETLSNVLSWSPYFEILRLNLSDWGCYPQWVTADHKVLTIFIDDVL
ncbi:MAG: hypothetical protein IPM91_13925 [Bacteroidetes bacterium]|nr:hypothetical protein [Bacteroidota bacterium]